MIVHASENPIILNEGLFFSKKDKQDLKDAANRIKNYIKELKEKKNKKNQLKKKEYDIEYIKLTPEEEAERDKIGKKIQQYVVTGLKKYASSKEFKNKYKNNLTPDSINIKKADVNSGYEVQISDWQLGMDINAIEKWEKENPDKSTEDCPIWNYDWYYDLLGYGSDLAEEAAEKFDPDDKFGFRQVHIEKGFSVYGIKSFPDIQITVTVICYGISPRYTNFLRTFLQFLL